MTDITTKLDATVTGVRADLNKVANEARAATGEIAMLIANRIGDLLIAAIVIASIWLGHAL
jgi:hypothetical protein